MKKDSLGELEKIAVNKTTAKMLDAITRDLGDPGDSQELPADDGRVPLYVECKAPDRYFVAHIIRGAPDPGVTFLRVNEATWVTLDIDQLFGARELCRVNGDDVKIHPTEALSTANYVNGWFKRIRSAYVTSLKKRQAGAEKREPQAREPMLSVVLKLPGSQARVIQIKDAKDGMNQALACDAVEIYFESDGIEYWGDDDALAKGKNLNLAIGHQLMWGRVLAMSMNEEGESFGLSEEQCEQAMKTLDAVHIDASAMSEEELNAFVEKADDKMVELVTKFHEGVQEAANKKKIGAAAKKKKRQETASKKKNQQVRKKKKR